MTAVYSVFIFALDSVIFALAMTIISILFYTILDKIIFSNKNMDDFNWLIALLSFDNTDDSDDFSDDSET